MFGTLAKRRIGERYANIPRSDDRSVRLGVGCRAGVGGVFAAGGFLDGAAGVFLAGVAGAGFAFGLGCWARRTLSRATGATIGSLSGSATYAEANGTSVTMSTKGNRPFALQQCAASACPVATVREPESPIPFGIHIGPYSFTCVQDGLQAASCSQTVLAVCPIGCTA